MIDVRDLRARACEIAQAAERLVLIEAALPKLRETKQLWFETPAIEIEVKETQLPTVLAVLCRELENERMNIMALMRKHKVVDDNDTVEPVSSADERPVRPPAIRGGMAIDA